MKYLIFISFIMMFLVSCGPVSQYVRIESIRPAEINLKGKNKIVVGTFEGTGGKNIESAIKDRVSSSGYLELIDRSNMEDIVKELEVSTSDLANSKIELGKIESASILIKGRIPVWNYTENIETTAMTCYKPEYESCVSNAENTCEKRAETLCKKSNDAGCQQDKEDACEQQEKRKCERKYTYACTKYTRRGKVNVSVSADVLDIETTKNIRSKILQCSKETSVSNIGSKPQSINRDSMFLSCTSSIAYDFIKVISPTTYSENVVFFTHGDVPMLETGVKFVETNDLDEAESYFRKAIKQITSSNDIDNDVIGAAHWDLAMVLKYKNNFTESVAEIKKAFKISGNNEYLDEIKNIEIRKKEVETLSEQGVK